MYKVSMYRCHNGCHAAHQGMLKYCLDKFIQRLSQSLRNFLNLSMTTSSPPHADSKTGPPIPRGSIPTTHSRASVHRLGSLSPCEMSSFCDRAVLDFLTRNIGRSTELASVGSRIPGLRNNVSGSTTRRLGGILLVAARIFQTRRIIFGSPAYVGVLLSIPLMSLSLTSSDSFSAINNSFFGISSLLSA